MSPGVVPHEMTWGHDHSTGYRTQCSWAEGEGGLRGGREGER